MGGNKLKELLKKDGNKFKADVVAALAIGVIFIIVGNTFFSGQKPKTPLPATETEDTFLSESESTKREREIEKRLEAVLSSVKGAGEIKVMVTTESYGEIQIAEETKKEQSTTTEAAQQGDERKIDVVTAESKAVILDNGDGSSSPLVLKKAEPKISGVVIVAKGGGDPIVKDALSKAAEALLNVPAHKVEVLQMK